MLLYCFVNFVFLQISSIKVSYFIFRWWLPTIWFWVPHKKHTWKLTFILRRFLKWKRYPFFPYLNPRSYLKTDRTKTVVLKEFEVLIKIESISFQTKVDHVDLWLAITKPSRIATSKLMQIKSKQNVVYSVSQCTAKKKKKKKSNS